MPLRIYPTPEGLTPSASYRLYVDGQEVFVYDAQVVLDAIDPARNVCAPYVSSYASFDADVGQSVEVCIVPLFETVQDVQVSPLSRGTAATHAPEEIRFTMQVPNQLSVEINGLIDRTMMIFANPPETNAPNPNDRNVIYFGPGVHIVDDPDNRIRLRSGQTLYLAGGAVVTGIVLAEDADDIKILGRGILHAGNVAGRWPDYWRGIVDWPADAPQRHSQVALKNCKRIEIGGVSLIDTPEWTLAIDHCEDIVIKNIKIIGYQINSDGIDLCGCKNVTVRDCFIRSSDDTIAVKCLYDPTGENVTTSDIEVTGCTLWADRASAIEIGHEACAAEIAYMRFADIDILHQREESYGYHAIDITNSDFADIHDILYEDIRIERCNRLFGLRVREGAFGSSGYSKGRIHNITLRNIRCDGNSAIFLMGRDDEHTVCGIRLENIYVKGQLLTSLAAIRRNPYVRDVTLFLDGKQADALEAYPSADQCIPLDISPICNIMAGKDIGLCGMESAVWMRLPSGVTVLEGIPFHITGQGYDSEGDYKRFAIPPNRRRGGVPARLAIDAKAEWLFFLQTAIHVTSETDSLLCRYVITYQDGSAETIFVRNRNDVHDWKHWSRAGWQVVFGELCAYIMPWRNPHLEKAIASVEMLDGEIPELPALMAITRA